MLTTKDPWEKITFIVDWGAQTSLVGRQIVSSEFESVPDGLTVTQPIVLDLGTKTGVRVEQGQPGERYRVRNLVTFDDGDRLVGVFTVDCRNK